MLSRFAENAFWMGRYIVRTESLSRLLLTTETFAGSDDSAAAWTPILKVFIDEENFERRNKSLSALNVVKFYLCEADNPNSAFAAVHMLKENARSLRHLISTESWRQISVFHGDMVRLSKRRFSLSELADICAEIRNACFTHRGVLEATWYRDEVWRFNQIGAALERADQMTRLIDMKYFDYDRDDVENVAPPDVAWWNSLLRSASGYHAFQRHHSFDPEPAHAAAFLLFDEQLFLSVRAAANSAFHHLGKLSNDFDADPGEAVNAACSALDALLDTPPTPVHGRPLHVYLDQLQLALIRLANALNERYFSPEI